MDVKAKLMHVISPMVLWLLKPRGYNTPWNFKMLYNQWLHQAFLWGWWDYDFYASHQKEVL